MERIHRADLGRESWQMRRIKPPKFAEKILSILSSSRKIGVLGDTEEEYRMIRLKKGQFKADIWYIWQIFLPLPLFIRSTVYWSYEMFKNYLKIALRNLKRHKGYSFINIFGLAVGMACAILILLWIQDELSYDRFHENANDIYRVVEKWRYSSGEMDYNRVTPGPLAPVLKADYPEIILSTRFFGAFEKWQLTYDKKSYLSPGAAVDNDFFSIFTFPFVKGNPHTAFSKPHSMVITDDLAKKFFGDDEPLGETIHLEHRTFVITGILENIPRNSHLRFDFLIPCEIFSSYMEGWTNNNCYTYVLLQKNQSYKGLSEKIAGIIKKHSPTAIETLYLQPLNQIHLYALEGSGLISYVYIFSALAFFILLIACINFMNLSTARSAKRFKEIGIKKVVGSSRIQLIKQFLSESILFSLVAFACAILLVELLLPVINNMLGLQLKMHYSGGLFLSLIGIAILTGIVSGSYPAFFLSSFNPATVLKGQLSLTLFNKWGARKDSNGFSRSSTFRRILVVTQFSLSIIFIVCALVVYSQLSFIKKRDLGFNKEHIVHLRMRGELRQKYEAIKNELLKNSNILSVTVTDRTPVMWSNSTDDVSWEGKRADEKIGIGVRMVDYDYLKTFQMEMAQGRFFSKEFLTDATEGFIVNEAAVKAMGMKSPLDKRFSLWSRQGKIIGVIKDFHTESLHKEIEPFVLLIYPDWYAWMSVKIKSDNVSSALRFLENKINEFVPGYPLEYQFLDEEIDNLYKTEQLTGKIIIYITLLALFISCLGLFGLASFTAEQRTKEIGIRKVLGASASGIAVLLSKEFTKWVVVASLIAWPIAYFIMNKWLHNFVYRTSIGWWTFIFAGGLALAFALVTVSYQSIKAALANPVDSLRYE